MSLKNYFTNAVQEFRKFAMRGNVMELAVGIIIGTAFNGIVNSLVKDVVMPPIGLILGRVDFSNLYINLGRTDYDSLAEAQLAGAPTVNYGMFINTIINFIIVAWAVFLLVKVVNRVNGNKKADKMKDTKKCEYCQTDIPEKATRCPNCTSQLKH
jgi:large conductance mechanosensitive channel